MTMILSLMTPDYVMQLSDRRLTLANHVLSRPVTIVSEMTNKAVILDNQFIFGFVGLAQLKLTKSDVWFSNRLAELAELPLGERFKIITRELTDIFNQIGYSAAHKRMAFVGVGWGIDKGKRQPVYIAITNFLNDKGEWAVRASNEFKLAHRYLPTGRHILLAHAGTSVPDFEWYSLEKFIRRANKGGLGPASLGVRLADFINFASSNDRSVGPYVMLSCIPKAVVDNYDATGEFISLAKLPDLNCASFVHLDTKARELEVFSPRFVAGGWVMSDLKVVPLSAFSPPSVRKF